MRKLLALSYILAALGFACIAHAQLTQTGAGPKAGGGGGGAVVQVDAQGTPVLTSSVTTFGYTGLTVSGANPNRAIVLAVVAADNAGASGMTASWGAQSMTPAFGSPYLGPDLAQYVWLFGLLGPNSGNLTLTLSWSTASQLNIGAISLFNVNSGTSFTATASNTGTGTTSTVTVPSASGNLALAAHSTDQGLTANNGTLWTIYAGGAPLYGARGNYLPGAGPNVTLTATQPASGSWIAAAVNVPN